MCKVTILLKSITFVVEVATRRFLDAQQRLSFKNSQTRCNYFIQLQEPNRVLLVDTINVVKLPWNQVNFFSFQMSVPTYYGDVLPVYYSIQKRKHYEYLKWKHVNNTWVSYNDISMHNGILITRVQSKNSRRLWYYVIINSRTRKL